MIIELDKFTIDLKESISRRIMREHKSIMLENSTVSDDNKVSFATGQFDKAVEFLIVSLIEKITDKENPEKVIRPSREWLDELDNIEFRIIEKEVTAIKNASDEKTKK
jgi:hypothetical protein